MPRPVALLSDFGHADAYAGVVKGVLLTRCPEARLFDLTHGIAPQDVLAGALHLAGAVPYCPPDTIFLAVVDPGVGSDRRGLVMRSGSRLFVGPDNGLLWPAACGCGTVEAFHLDRPRYWLPEIAPTFHGRDIFAPIAAMLVLGRAPEDFGSPIDDAVRLEIPRCSPENGGVAGEVLLIDRFGNAVTNLRPADLGNPEPNTLTFRTGEHVIRGPATHYGAVPVGDPVVVLGSLGYFEVSVNCSGAAECLGLTRGVPVTAAPL